MADLTTFIPVRHQPTGPVETFSTERAADTVAGRDPRPRTSRRSCCASRTARAAQVAVSQVSPGRKNSLQYEIDGSASAVAWDSEQPDQLWIGHRDRPNELLLRNPALMNAAGRRGRAAARRPRRGLRRHVRRPVPAIYDGRRSPGGRRPRPRYPTFADGHDEMLVGDAIAESARDGALGRRRRDDPPRRRRPCHAAASPPPTEDRRDEARLPDRPVPRDAARRRSPTGPPAAGFEVLEIACWPRRDRPDPPLRRHEPHRRRQPVRRRRRRRSSTRSPAKGLLDLRPRLLPEPAPPGPGPPRRRSSATSST